MRCIIFRSDLDAVLGDDPLTPFAIASLAGQDHIQGVKNFGIHEALQLVKKLPQEHVLENLLEKVLGLLPPAKKEMGKESMKHTISLKSFYDAGVAPTLIEAGEGEGEDNFESSLDDFLQERDEKWKVRRGTLASRVQQAMANGIVELPETQDDPDLFFFCCSRDFKHVVPARNGRH